MFRCEAAFLSLYVYDTSSSGGDDYHEEQKIMWIEQLGVSIWFSW